MVRVLTVNGVTDLEVDALGHVLQIVYLIKEVMQNRANSIKHTSLYAHEKHLIKYEIKFYCYRNMRLVLQFIIKT